MSGPQAFGLEWNEAEIDAVWQGITALGFSGVVPPGVAAELIVTLNKASDGLLAVDLALSGPDGAPLAADVLPVADGDLTLRVRFAQTGPRGLSRVRLTSGGANPLHPFFTESTFDFFIDCPAGDCHAPPEADPAATGAAPAIDLSTKDYAGFLQVARDWALATDPNWGDLSPASTEAMLLELLAYHAEMLSLHQDRVAQEAFIDTARERQSLRRHAAFLGLVLDEGALAQAIVAVDVAPGQAGYLPAGTRIVRQEGSGRVTATFVTEEVVRVDAAWNAGLSAASDRGELVPAAWPGAPDAALPAGAVQMLLLDWDSGLLPGQSLALVQGRRAHVARLTLVEEIEAPGWTADPADPLGIAPRRLTRIQWDLPTVVRFAPWADPVAEPFLMTANLVPVRHGEPVSASNIAGFGDMRIGASRLDLVATGPSGGPRWIRALRTPESGVLIEPDGRPALTLTIGGAVWSWQPDLRTSAGFDRHYATERDEDGAVWLLFGDGQRGQALPLHPSTGPEGLGGDAGIPASVIRIDWRRGIAEDGNLGAFALNAALPPVQGDAGVAADFAALGLRAATNLLPATGGRRAVPMDVARKLIPESIRHPPRERCVTADDYARAAEEVPGVAQAAALPLGGLFNTIAVLCAPPEGEALPPDVAEAVHDRLDRLRMAGREHLVRPPNYVPLDISLLICPRSGSGLGSAGIRASVVRALAPSRGAAPGFFDRSRLGFGATVRLADILAAVARAPGVGAVKALAFRPLFEAGGAAVRAAVAMAPTEIALFEADESRPERGRLAVRIEGMDAAVPGAGFVIATPAPEPVTGGIQ
jgi:uncharacterized phage protein gp47/JayE